MKNEAEKRYEALVKFGAEPERARKIIDYVYSKEGNNQNAPIILGNYMGYLSRNNMKLEKMLGDLEKTFKLEK